MGMVSGGRASDHVAMASTTAELCDSSELLRDGTELRRRFREDGYLLFRGLLDTAPLAQLRADILRVISEHGWTAAGTDPSDAVPSEPARWHIGPGWRDGYIAIQQLESFHRQAFAAEVLSMLGDLFGTTTDEVLPHDQRIARVIWP